jgi:hypothetical protein
MLSFAITSVLSEGCCDFAMTLIFLQEEKSRSIDLIAEPSPISLAVSAH